MSQTIFLSFFSTSVQQSDALYMITFKTTLIIRHSPEAVFTFIVIDFPSSIAGSVTKTYLVGVLKLCMISTFCKDMNGRMT